MASKQRDKTDVTSAEEAILQESSEHLRYLVGVAYERVQAMNPEKEPGLIEVLEELNRIVRTEYGPDRKQVEPPVLSPFPAGEALQYMLLRAIGPSVERARLEIVGAADGDFALPFATVEEGVAWIEREAYVPHESVPEDQLERYRTLGETARLALDKQAELLGGWEHRRAEVWRPLETVAYSAPISGLPCHVPVPRGSPLLPLARAARMIAEATGFSAAHVTAHILADAPIPFNPVVVGERLLWESLPTGERVDRDEVVVTFRSPDLTLEELREVYRMIRNRWRPWKRLTKKEAVLLRIVDELGGPPGRKRANKQDPIWPNVQSRMQDDGYNYKSPRAVANAYRAAKKKLARTVRVSPAKAEPAGPQGPSVRVQPRRGGDATIADPEALRHEAIRNQDGFRVFWSPPYGYPREAAGEERS